jgi:hypothetical protein
LNLSATFSVLPVIEEYVIKHLLPIIASIHFSSLNTPAMHPTGKWLTEKFPNNYISRMKIDFILFQINCQG